MEELREPARRRVLRSLPFRALVASLLTALAARLLGGQAFWLCVPVALALASLAEGDRRALLAAALPVVAAALAASGPLPSLLLALVVVGASLLVLQRVRVRTRDEREALRSSALSDPLTGVANRRGLEERVDYEIARHARLRHSFAVVALDLDGFKAVNDRFGHPAGDELLRDVADALGRGLRDQDTVARLGGDEFCVLAPETDRAGAERLAGRLEVALGRVTAGLDSVSASLGIALYPDDGSDAAGVLAAADAAQVAAKRGRRRARAA